MLLKKIIIFLLSFTYLKFLASEAWIKAGYWYSGSGYPVMDINSALFTHLVFGFVHINTSSYELSISSSSEPYVSTFTESVKKKNPSVATLLSVWGGEAEPFVGGEANSSMFFSMVSESSRRKSFIQSSITKARSYGFHGLEIFGANPDTPENMTNMGVFLDEWRAAVDKDLNHNSSPPLILTMGGYYSPAKNSMSYPVDSIRRNMDWVHLRSYDYHMSSKDKFTAAHAALYDPLSTLNTDYGIKEWLTKGLPANKLVLGLPYHGYAWTLLDPKNNAIGAPAKGTAITVDGTVNYKTIKQYTNSYRAASVFNSTYVVNYCTFESFWIGYDDVEAIKIKVSYAKEKGLLGYIVFQVPNDDKDWTLSRAAHLAAEDHTEKRLKILKISLPAISIVLLLGATICCFWRKIMTLKGLWTNASEKRSTPPNLQVFSFANMKEATQNFSEENKLGQGGFGPVYKGKLPDGQEIAVKRLSLCSKQGSEEFKNELTLSAKLQHVNIVRLLGFCAEKGEKMLVYEYMPNRSLDFYLFNSFRSLSFDWEKRVRVIDGIAQGLLYLQEFSIYTVIHRDLKVSNILLDADMKPRISDFGIARIFRKNEDKANTGRIIGTYGYVPPEYVKRGIYSRKYDIYSFGVLLLQILSGKSTSCLYGDQKNLNLLEYGYNLWKDGNAMDFMDPSLDDASSSCKLIRCLQVALLCVQEKWEDRPSMLEVYSMLKNETETLPIPSVPAFSITKNESEESKIFISNEEFCSANIVTISEVLPR